MSKLLTLALLLFSLPADASPRLCSLHGKIRIVSKFATYKVRVVTSNEDLRVHKVTTFPESAGEWQFVEEFQDFTVEFVTSGEDFTIKWVNVFSGCTR